MRKASTELLEQGTQTPSPAPDLIPAEGKNQPRTHIGIGTVNGGTSETLTPEEILLRFKKLFGRDMTSQEMGCFFFRCELTPDSAPDKKSAPMPATHF